MESASKQDLLEGVSFGGGVKTRCMHRLPWGQTSCNKCLRSELAEVLTV